MPAPVQPIYPPSMVAVAQAVKIPLLPVNMEVGYPYVFEDVSWEEYRAWRGLVPRKGLKYEYNQGRLTVVPTGPTHENAAFFFNVS